MILSAQSIRARRVDAPHDRRYSKSAGRHMIEPFVERIVHDNGKSYGLGPASYDVRVKREVMLEPGLLEIASTLEHVCIPDDIAAQILDKSSWIRKGVSAFNTWIDPGFRGHITLELVNHTPMTIIIGAGEPIVQLVFFRLDAPTESPYSGKYQDQPDWPVTAIHEAPGGPEGVPGASLSPSSLSPSFRGAQQPAAREILRSSYYPLTHAISDAQKQFARGEVDE
jgi:dCTP deaminase